jgi:cobaltochelatase CobN
VRLANLGKLSHPLSVDLYIEKTVAGAKLVVVRAMGGVGYWPYGLEQLRKLARAEGGPALIVVPGEDRWDAPLEAYSTVPAEDVPARMALSRRGRRGERAPGAGAVRPSARAAASAPAAPVVCRMPGSIGRASARSGWRMWRRMSTCEAGCRADRLLPLGDAGGADGAGRCAGGGARALGALRGCRCSWRASRIASRRRSCGAVRALSAGSGLNTTSFAVSKIGAAHGGTVLDAPGRPVLQVVFAGLERGGVARERAGARTARPHHERGVAGGRRAHPDASGVVQGGAGGGGDLCSGCRPHQLRGGQAAAWVRLGAKPAGERRVAIVLSNYPDRDGRIANGVGLDTPESAVRIAAAMRAAGYAMPGFPESGAGVDGGVAGRGDERSRAPSPFRPSAKSAATGLRRQGRKPSPHRGEGNCAYCDVGGSSARSPLGFRLGDDETRKP